MPNEERLLVNIALMMVTMRNCDVDRLISGLLELYTNQCRIKVRGTCE
jgi:hypothetical protein